MAVLLFTATAAKAQFYGVKINTLALTTGTVNGGVEIAVGKQWSLDIPAYWNPINTDSFSSKLWYVQPGVRWWMYEHFVGHFFAGHVAYGHYNVGDRDKYFKGWFTGLGVSYGYTWIIGRQWNLTAEGGLGLYFMRHKRKLRTIEDWSPECIRHTKRVAMLPSKLDVTFSYLF